MSKEATWASLFIPETPKTSKKETYQRDQSYGRVKEKGTSKGTRMNTKQIISAYLEEED